MPSKSTLLKFSAALLLACGLLAACSTLIGPRQVELPQERLQQSLARKFPMRHRVLAVFDVALDHPQLSIAGGDDRVALALDVTVVPLLARQSWSGSLLISGRLVMDPARNAIVIADAHVDKLAFNNMDEGRQNQLAGIANLLGEQVIKDVAVHTFQPDDLRYAGVQFAVTHISTKPGALVATLTPAQ
ncbi:DUF1439 domain-containing protein [Rugamonas sp.]|uniref:DUF1439 domain-containing protein n=1 Tax=Rugamonas sp. TaxID=1926287 RepID=UPI0025E2C46C|nr:DUF1439 domain-containing protein [Rugamonas sp.]